MLYGLYNRHDPQAVVDFASAAAFGKLQELSDDTGQSVAEVTGRLHTLHISARVDSMDSVDSIGSV